MFYFIYHPRDYFVLRNIQKVYIEANDISGSKRVITAHAIGLSLRLSVFNLALAWWLHNMYGLNWVLDSQTRFFFRFFEREKKFWKWDLDQEQEVTHHVDHVAPTNLATFQCDGIILQLCLFEKMLPSDWDLNHSFKLKTDLTIFLTNFVILTGTVQKKVAVHWRADHEA